MFQSFVWGRIFYRGWELYEDRIGPMTGRWRAIKHGVTIGAHSLDALKAMIDAHELDRAIR